MTSPDDLLSDTDRDTYRDDGAVCLRGVYDPKAIAALLKAWDRVSSDPVASGLVRRAPSIAKWATAPISSADRPMQLKRFRDFIRTRRPRPCLGALLDAKEIGFYWDTIFEKKAGSTWPTTWHTDAGATAILGNTLVNVWTPLTPVTKQSSLEILAGTHHTDILYWPRSPNGARLEKPDDSTLVPGLRGRAGRTRTPVHFVGYGTRRCCCDAPENRPLQPWQSDGPTSGRLCHVVVRRRCCVGPAAGMRRRPLGSAVCVDASRRTPQPPAVSDPVAGGRIAV